MKYVFVCFLTAFLTLGSFLLFGQGASEPYFPATHSHNDYYQDRPLFDALESGMTSIEPDVYYVEYTIIDDKGNQRVYKDLLVAHNWEEITGAPGWSSPKGTLQNLYLDPLYEIYKEKDGMIFNSPDQKLLLHVDFKTDCDKTWNVLQSQLANYPGLFTTFHKDSAEVIDGPVIVFTSHEPKEIPDEWSVFYSTVDGRFGNIFDPNVWESEEYQSRKHRTVIVSSNILAYNDITKFFHYLVPKQDIVEKYAEDYPGLTQGNFYTALRQTIDGKTWKLAVQLVEDGMMKVSDYLVEQMKEADRIGREYGTLMRFWAPPDAEWFWDIQRDLDHVVILTDYPHELMKYLMSD